MKTVYAFIRHQGNSLAVDFPLNIYDMPDHLGSIGVRLPPGKVAVADTKDLSVKLTGLNEVGEAIVEKLAGSDSLVDINTLCQAIEQACPYGYEDMADRLAASDSKSAKELMQVVDEFIQTQQSQQMGGILRRFLYIRRRLFVAGKEAASMDKGKKSQQKQENGDAHAPPGKRYTVPPPKDTTRCKGCPYPRVGFICWKLPADRYGQDRQAGEVRTD
ncbi:hypothetical protein Dtox_0433 [Desulfofarcimen acetoxidans DSM 771]|jgi:hypothetical protein|uniref:Uncharacterized protein n=1 Tax=Desulfofarcimen acetoxidans (strain ATCC 49208 / DSM 771 / KCTC 5769 / VKM B-1644 / 5575) TaxID=485916 RepID=C8W512_DESAS|nr:hypothetical protein Dtox_0433 [Desulfofarcimen acetoxidans DSM 771]